MRNFAYWGGCTQLEPDDRGSAATNEIITHAVALLSGEPHAATATRSPCAVSTLLQAVVLKTGSVAPPPVRAVLAVIYGTFRQSPHSGRLGTGGVLRALSAGDFFPFLNFDCVQSAVQCVSLVASSAGGERCALAPHVSP
eukprot:IDg17932t1